VVGAAAYTKGRGAAEYTMSVSWRPDAPMANFPLILSSAVEDVLRRGVARIWTDLDDNQTAQDVAVRALAIVPIRRERDIIGALCAFDVAPHALRDEDLDLLSAIAAGSLPRRGLPAVPIDREAADTIIRRELVRSGGDPQPLTVMLFAMTTQSSNELSPFDDILASLVRGNDLVVRWTPSQVVVVLAGVDNGLAQRVAGRISEIVETKTPQGAAVSSAVIEVGRAESLEDTIARAAATMSSSSSGGPSAAVPRLPVPSRGYRAATGNTRRRPQA
jgi:GAF domain-containing protein